MGRRLLICASCVIALVMIVMAWRGRTWDADMGNWCTERVAGGIVLYRLEQGSWPSGGLADLESAGLIEFDAARTRFRVPRVSDCCVRFLHDDRLEIDARLITIADSPDAEVLVDWKGWGRGYLDRSLVGLSETIRYCISREAQGPE